MTGYESFLRDKMGIKRYQHSVAVSHQAALLARRHGADEEKAALAGLLHDVCKEFPQEKQLEIIKKHGIVLSSGFFRQVPGFMGFQGPVQVFRFPGVLHQISAPPYLEDELGLFDEEVLSAIRWHTTGRPGMSPMEKILFVADVTSQDRAYGDVEHYRELALRDLDEAVFQVLKFTLGNLAEREAAVCPDTVHAYNDSLEKRRDKL